MRNIIVDHRERAVIPYITIIHQVKQLPIGDYIIHENDCTPFIIERKTLEDLSASIKDKRIYNQVAILKLLNRPFAFVIEGERKTYQYKRKFNKHLLPLSSLTTRIQHMKDDNILILYTRSITETVKLLETMPIL
jgi:ERCC4-type nuclease